MKKIYDGTTIGYNRIAVFKTIISDEIKIVLTGVREKPYIKFKSFTN